MFTFLYKYKRGDKLFTCHCQVRNPRLLEEIPQAKLLEPEEVKLLAKLKKEKPLEHMIQKKLAR